MGRLAKYGSHFFLLLLASLSLYAQPYGHEWIDFDNPNPTFKIKISQEGLYRLSHGTLADALQQAGLSIANVDPRDIQVFARGEQVPIYIDGEADGSFDLNDFIEFYAYGNDGWLDTRMYPTPAHQTNPYYSNFNDTIGYFLTWNSQPGEQHLRLQQVPNNVSNPPAKENYFMHTLVQEYHNEWQAGESYSASGQYLYNSNFLAGEGFLRNDFNKSNQTAAVAIPGIYTAGPVQQATVSTRFASFFEQQHRVRWSLNGNVLGDTVFWGERSTTLQRQVNLSLFNNNGTPDAFLYEALGTGGSDRNAVGFVRVDYPRNFDFNNANQFRFTLKGTTGSTTYFEMDNFDHQGQEPILVDLANGQRMLGKVAGSSVQYRLTYFQTDSADLFVTAQPQIQSISTLEEVTFYDFTTPASQGDYLLIYHPALRDDGQGNDWIAQYINYRSSINGGGHAVVPMDVNVLYDQFSYGIPKHPLAIKHAINFAVDSFAATPEHVFLMGRAIEYQQGRTNSTRYRQTLVPTYGHPGSDLMLTTRKSAYTPKIAIGRLAARNGGQVGIYLDKVKALEANQRSPVQTIANKSWMKTGLHLAGGNDANQRERFEGYLGKYERVFKLPKYGGDIYSFRKNSDEPIQVVQSAFLDSLISSGLSIITFFGHSSNNSFDVSLDNPANYDNYGKFPLLVSNGCFSGQIHTHSTGVSDKFIFEPDGGAIGFIASVSFGEEMRLNSFTRTFYNYFSNWGYGNTIGQNLKLTFKDIEPNNPGSDIITAMLMQQNSLHGDPAVLLNTHEKPDYVLEEPRVSTNPGVVSLENDSFDISFQLFNLGLAARDTLSVELQRTFPNGNIDLKTVEIVAPYFEDHYTITLPTDRVQGVGINQFSLMVDALNEVDEISESNNLVNFEVLIQSSEAIPISPYNFAIVGEPDVVLRASTANLQAKSKTYFMQIDTTAQFNSLALQEQQLTQSGGVLEWTPPVAWQNEQVYYWRISPAFTHPDSAKWNTRSFVYIANSEPGWNQSHHEQWTGNEFNNLVLDQNQFSFITDLKEVQITNCIYSFHPWDEVSRVVINGDMVQSWSYLGAGVIVTVIDSLSGLAWRHIDHEYGERGYNHSTMRDAFHYRIDNLSERASLIRLLDSVPDGHLIIVQSFQRPSYKGLKNDSITLGTSLLHTLRDKGAPELFYLDTLNYRPPWTFVYRQGNPNDRFLMLGDRESAYLDTTIILNGTWVQGFMTSPLIGPATAWGKVEWQYDTTVDPAGTDSFNLTVFGQRVDESLERIAFRTNQQDTTLQNTLPSDFPYLMLDTYLEDKVNRSAPQLDYWRVYYDPIGDLGFNPAKRFSLNSDSVLQGQEVKVATVMENSTAYAIDSVPLTAYLLSSNGSREYLYNDTIPTALPGDTIHFDLTFNTSGFAGRKLLLLEINPDKTVKEQYFFNNQLQIPITINVDNSNPLLDVTFDGRHIMNGEIVSARPEIRVKLKDENTFLALNDTSLLNMRLMYPTGLTENVALGDPRVEFIPADSTQLDEENEAIVIFRPEFKSDGEYELIIQARDRSGNNAGKLDYRVSFEVITKAMISNVLNYPNPFTSNTQFVFTLTGSEVPEFMKIQIMTVSGKVIREITDTEMGPIRIGTNRTEFRWDGTDQYGDPVANGLYLYRVVARQNGQQMEHFANDRIDRYFESGFGKMYLAR